MSGLLSHNKVTPNRGELAFGAVTGTTAGTANTVLTTTMDSVQVSFENTTDVQLIITRGGVDFKRVPAGNFRVFDLKGNGVGFAPVVWGVYRAAGAPASGVIEVVAIPFR